MCVMSIFVDTLLQQYNKKNLTKDKRNLGTMPIPTTSEEKNMTNLAR